MSLPRITAALLVGVAMIVPATPVGAAEPTPVDVVSVNRVVVNRLGGVSVSGVMSCAASAALLKQNKYEAEAESGTWGIVPVAPTDKLLLLSNPDNYTVRQPQGGRFTVQVTHVTSRAHPCYTEVATQPDDGTPVTCPVGETCTWATDKFGYNPANGPFFDYATSGKFRTGYVNVDGNSTGLWIQVIHSNGSYNSYSNDEGFFESYNQVIRATSVR